MISRSLHRLLASLLLLATPALAQRLDQLPVVTSSTSTARLLLIPPSGTTAQTITIANFGASGSGFTLNAANLTGNLPALNGSALTALNASNIASGSLALGRIAAGGASSGQVLRYSGSAWEPAAAGTGFRVTTATGNGTTDDTAAIQADFAALQAAGGGALYFPPGTYLVTATCAITASGNYHIFGAGRASVIKAQGDFGDIFRIGPTNQPGSGPPGYSGSWAGAAWHHIEGLDFISTVARTSGAAIHSRFTHDAVIKHITSGKGGGRFGDSPELFIGIHAHGQDQLIVEHCEIAATNTCFKINSVVGSYGPFRMNGYIHHTFARGNYPAEPTSTTLGYDLTGAGGLHLLEAVAENVATGFYVNSAREVDFRFCIGDTIRFHAYHVELAERVTFNGCWLSAPGSTGESPARGLWIEEAGTVLIAGFNGDSCPEGETLRIDTSNDVTIVGSRIAAAFGASGNYMPAFVLGVDVEQAFISGNKWTGTASLRAATLNTANNSNGGTLSTTGTPHITRFNSITVGAAAAGDYFSLDSGTGEKNYYFTVDGNGTGPGGTDVLVLDIETGVTTDADVRDAIQAAIEANSATSGALDGDTLVITDDANVLRSDAASSNTDFLVVVNFQRGS